MKILDETMYILETIEYDKTDSDKYQLMTGKEVLEFIKERAVDILEDYERVGYDDLVWIGIIEFLKNTIDGDEKSIDEFLDIYSYNVGAYHGYLYNPKMREMKKEIEELGLYVFVEENYLEEIEEWWQYLGVCLNVEKDADAYITNDDVAFCKYVLISDEDLCKIRDIAISKDVPIVGLPEHLQK